MEDGEEKKNEIYRKGQRDILMNSTNYLTMFFDTMLQPARKASYKNQIETINEKKNFSLETGLKRAIILT